MEKAPQLKLSDFDQFKRDVVVNDPLSQNNFNRFGSVESMNILSRKHSENIVTQDYFFNIDTQLSHALKYLQFLNENDKEKSQEKKNPSDNIEDGSYLKNMSQKFFSVMDESPSEVGFFAELAITFKAERDEIERGYLAKMQVAILERK
jgi:glycosylphosphatidylinositol transamidase (GPIT) subunit GPI8